jgi:NADH:ubiquinone oxidoreductase subunit 3 (subunit A)
MWTNPNRGRTFAFYDAVLCLHIDVMSIFLYAWGSSLLSIPKEATLPMMAFLGIMFAAMGYALYLSGRKGIW